NVAFLKRGGLSALTVRKEPARFGILGHHRNPGAVEWPLRRVLRPNQLYGASYMEKQTSISRLVVALAIPLLFVASRGTTCPGAMTKVKIDLNTIAPIGYEICADSATETRTSESR